jgi:hypothetical protein
MENSGGSRLLLVIGIAVCALLAAGLAYGTGGAFTASDGVIDACANSVNGRLRLVQSGTLPAALTECKNGEIAISWNRAGPRGDTGLQGQVGPAGPTGSAVAYARVLADGSLDAQRSLNVTSSVRTAIGTSPLSAYCFDISVTVTNVAATTENTVFPTSPMPGMSPPPPGGFNMGPTEINATVVPEIAQGWSCPAGTDAAVAVPRAEVFYVAFN